MTRLGQTTVTVIVALLCICVVSGASGSCLSYGHSCWGAHGKRSGPPTRISNEEIPALAVASPDDTRWFISKLIEQTIPENSDNTADESFKLWQRIKAYKALEKRDNVERSSLRVGGERFGIVLPDTEAEAAQDTNQDGGDILLVAEENPNGNAHNLRLYKIMEHIARKLD